jgi:HlyD family secretion protein
VATAQQLAARQSEVQTAQELVTAAVFAARAAAADVVRAQARLAPAASADSGRVVPVTAPVDGVVLKRVRESESVVPAGDPLVEIGNPRQLEIVADLLSVDAVKIAPGARAIVDQWGGTHPLDARVLRVEPSGFTKISALGDGYRVEVRIVTWEAADVLKIPTGTLIRDGEQWAVYLLQDGRARRVPVTVGHQNGQEAEIIGGLEAGASVILHPGDTIADGVRVTPRQAAE